MDFHELAKTLEREQLNRLPGHPQSWGLAHEALHQDLQGLANVKMELGLELPQLLNVEDTTPRPVHRSADADLLQKQVEQGRHLRELARQRKS